MSGVLAVLRIELRHLRHDPLPAALLVGMPIVLMVMLSRAMDLAIADEGYLGVTGSAQTVPGMACVFAFFASAIASFSVFREYGWRTWPRLRASGLDSRTLLVAKLVLPAMMLVAQHVLLFGFGVLFLDFDNAGPWGAIALTAGALSLVVLTAGIAATAVLSTVQQVNAVTNLGAMVFGGLGGGFVPVAALPPWMADVAFVSPVYWAMKAYRAVILDGEGYGAIAVPCLVLLGYATVFAVVGIRWLRLDRPKRTWG
ncbi:MAG: ABC transporter permease [Patulibacter minatonensis]